MVPQCCSRLAVAEDVEDNAAGAHRTVRTGPLGGLSTVGHDDRGAVDRGPRGRQHHGRVRGDADGELLRRRRDTGVQPAPAVVVGEVRHEGRRHQAQPGLPGGVVRAEGGDALGLDRVEVGLGRVGLRGPARTQHGGHRAVGQHDGGRAHGGRHGIPEGGVGHRRRERGRGVAGEDDGGGAGQRLVRPALAAVDHRGHGAGPAGLLHGLRVGVGQRARAGTAAEDDEPGRLRGVDGLRRGHDVADDVGTERAAAEEHGAADARRGGRGRPRAGGGRCDDRATAGEDPAAEVVGRAVGHQVGQHVAGGQRGRAADPRVGRVQGLEVDDGHRAVTEQARERRVAGVADAGRVVDPDAHRAGATEPLVGGRQGGQGAPEAAALVEVLVEDRPGGADDEAALEVAVAVVPPHQGRVAPQAEPGVVGQGGVAVDHVARLDGGAGAGAAQHHAPLPHARGDGRLGGGAGEHVHRDLLVATEHVDAVGRGGVQGRRVGGVHRVGAVEQHGQGGGAPGVGGGHDGVAGGVDLVGALLREGQVGLAVLVGVAVGGRHHDEVDGRAAGTLGGGAREAGERRRLVAPADGDEHGRLGVGGPGGATAGDDRCRGDDDGEGEQSGRAGAAGGAAGAGVRGHGDEPSENSRVRRGGCPAKVREAPCGRRPEVARREPSAQGGPRARHRRGAA